ncbi:MAG TPA: hypothetical protein PKD75_07035 [Tepidiformaceae bacterium]|nr:hypothetical protein [Tepidiformaceae bacterium]
MTSLPRPRTGHAWPPNDFGLGIVATLAVLLVLGFVLLWASTLPSRGPLAEPRAPSVTAEAGPQSPPPSVAP